METELDRELEKAQAALLARYAPETRVRRVRWSHGETQVLELGTGAPLLLVHGGADGAFEWVPILSALAQTTDACSPLTAPVTGWRTRSTTEASTSSTTRAHSFGTRSTRSSSLRRTSPRTPSAGSASVAFALDKPERVSRLALVGAPPGVTREAPLLLRLMSLRLIGEPLARLMMRNPTRDGARKFWGQMQVAHPERLDDTLLDVDVAHTRRNLDTILSLLRCIGDGIRDRSLILGDRWDMLLVPTLFLRGDHDAFITEQADNAWDAIAARNPNVRIVRIPDAGHLPWLDQPERVVTEIEHFLSTPPSTVEAAAKSSPRPTSAAAIESATASRRA